MSFLRSSFSLKRPEPRKALSLNPLRLTAEERTREFGPLCSTIQVNLGGQNIEYNSENGIWNMDEIENVGAKPTEKNRRKIEKELHILKEENNMLRLKVEILLNLVAESVAELRNGK